MMDVKNSSNEIQKVKAYIKKHGAPRNMRFDVNLREVFAMAFGLHPIDGVVLAFLYGRAKGYQQAKRNCNRKAHRRIGRGDLLWPFPL